MRMNIEYVFDTLRDFQNTQHLPVSIFGESPKLPEVAQYTVSLLTLSLGMVTSEHFKQFHHIGRIPYFMTNAISSLTQHVCPDCTGTLQTHSAESTVSVKTLLDHMQSTMRHKHRTEFFRSEVVAAYPDQEAADEIVKKSVASNAANRLLLKAQISRFKGHMQPTTHHAPTQQGTTPLQGNFPLQG